jgi:glycerol-1-phosphate dehydrogenase [NAD(P)+]
MCIAAGASLRLPALLSDHKMKFARPLLVTGGALLREKASRIAASLPGDPVMVSVEKSTFEETERLKEKMDDAGPDIVIGVGGGVVLDVAKYASSEKAIGFISLPTAVSNDGIASPVSVIRVGGKAKSIPTHMPMAVVADLDLIRTAPASTIRSGIGDLVSNLSACADWRLAYHKGKEGLDEFTETISRNSALRILSAPRASLTDADFLKVLIEGLIMSGIAMGIYGNSRPSSGSEHMISHAIDHFLNKENSHGAQVGVATLFTLGLHQMDRVPLRSLFREFSMPLRPEDLNLTRKEFLFAVSKAPLMRPGRYSILNETTRAQVEKAYHEAFE